MGGNLMIFVDIKGGLGNQLFQYATAKSLAVNKNSNFLMNLDEYSKEYSKKIDHVEFKLNHFNVDCNNKIITENQIYEEYDDVQKIIEPLSSDNIVKFINLNNYSGNIHLKGYWQDENYFKYNKKIIHQDLKVITPPNKKNEMMLDEILNTNSVCLSFRRGEYLDKYFLAQYGMCTEEYYKTAIKLISKRISNPTFYIFSDDINWIEDNVKLEYDTIPINFNGVGYEHEELRLMYSCKHFILANSSFSWWGAWLSDYENKIVFAPTPWFNSYTKQSILCKKWIHLKCNRADLFNKSNFKIFELLNDYYLGMLDYENMEKGMGDYGISLNSLNKNAKFNFKFENTNVGEYIIELKLFSNNEGLIKINYGQPRRIALGYNNGHSVKYVHLMDIDLNDLFFEINDESLIIQDISIKKVDSNFNLIIK